MAYAFKAANRFTPVLQTKYIQNPPVNRSKVEYTPGTRHAKPISKFIAVSVKYTIRIVTEYGELLYSNIALPETQTQTIWFDIKDKVFELFENDPVVYGTLQGLQDIQTGDVYQYGYNVPARNGIFKPMVVF
jgi:hypothetical protein